MTLLLIKLLVTSLFLFFAAALPNATTKEMYNIQTVVTCVLLYISVILAIMVGLSIIWIGF